MTISTSADVHSAAELERRRIAKQAARARAGAQTQAQEAEAETEEQARQAISETGRQAQQVKSQAEEEAQTRQAAIRKQRGQAEEEAQTAMAKARQARNIEQRKVVLPFTKPQDLGTASYISAVEMARKQAQQSGEDAKRAVTRVRDEYFKQVDKAKDDAIADINKQKAGIVRDIQTQLVNFNTDVAKQIAQLNSGISEWEAGSKAKLEKAQADYEAALKVTLNRPGTEVFADMKDKGLMPADAIYQSYDKTTGQLNYTIPDTRTGQEIFNDLVTQNQIPDNATFKSYDAATGKITYAIPSGAGNASQNVTTSGAQDLSPSSNTINVVAGSLAAGGIACALVEAGGITASVPTPPTWVIGAILAAVGIVVGIVEHKRIVSNIQAIIDKAKGKSGGSSSQAGDAVVTNNAGSVAYSIQQFTTIPQTKKGSIEGIPLAEERAQMLVNRNVDIKPISEGYKLTSESFEVPGVPMISGEEIVMIRDTFDVPELRAKGSNLEMAVAGVQTAANNLQRIATKEIPVTREQWEKINEALRQGRITQGRKIIEDIAEKADSPSIAKSFKLAYEDYLRKKAILDAARKSYVASLNPRPIKGKGSADATAAAIGVWLVQDIMQASIARSLRQGKTLEQAMTEAQEEVQAAAKELGLTQQQINAGTATVVYQVAVSNMAQEAIQTAALGQTEGLTATELKAQTLAAIKAAATEAVQTAVATQTLTQTQARTLENELTRVAEQVAETTLKLKLPKLSDDQVAALNKDKYPKGTIVWNQGKLSGKGDEYKIIPPPYTMDKPITSFTPPKGMIKTKGTPQETLTFIGGKVPFKNVSFDLGVADGFIDVKDKTIKFTGGGQKTNVGTRRPETTKGIALTDNPPLLQQLTQPKGSRRAKKEHGHSNMISLARPVRSKERSLVSHGVYSDSKGTRISRKRHRRWKRIY